VKAPALLDLALLLAPPAALAVFVTAHVAIVLGLVTKPPRWRAPLALVLPPLAFLWGKQAKMTALCRVWLGALLAYALTLALATAS
jgi:hypothetical protein